MVYLSEMRLTPNSAPARPFQKHQHHFCLFNTFQPWQDQYQRYDYPGARNASQEPGQHPAPLPGRCSPGQLSVLLASSLFLCSTDWFRACFSQSRGICLNQDSWAWLAGGGHRRQKGKPLPRSVWQVLGEKDEYKGPVLSGKE